MTPQKIKELRKRMGLTQLQFATLLGVSVVSINRWETGKHAPSDMAIKQIQRIVEEMNRKLKDHNICL